MTRLPTTQSNRGMELETLLNVTNDVYRNRGMAVVEKVPTPVKVTKSKGSIILKGFFEAKSTVDYYGVYNGRPLQFEAKQTKEMHRFPLDNIHPHQVEYMRGCLNQGAVTFVVLEFTARHETFFVDAKMVVNAWDKAKEGARKSIPYDDINVMCYLIKPGRGVPLDYLAIVDKLHSKQVG